MVLSLLFGYTSWRLFGNILCFSVCSCERRSPHRHQHYVAVLFSSKVGHSKGDDSVSIFADELWVNRMQVLLLLCRAVGVNDGVDHAFSLYTFCIFVCK